MVLVSHPAPQSGSREACSFKIKVKSRARGYIQKASGVWPETPQESNIRIRIKQLLGLVSHDNGWEHLINQFQTHYLYGSGFCMTREIGQCVQRSGLTFQVPGCPSNLHGSHSFARYDLHQTTFQNKTRTL